MTVNFSFISAETDIDSYLRETTLLIVSLMGLSWDKAQGQNQLSPLILQMSDDWSFWEDSRTSNRNVKKE